MVLKTLGNNWPLFFGILLIMVGAGLQGTLLGIRGESEGFSTQLIGVLMSCYYLGFLGGYFFAPSLINSVGHIRVFVALASLASTAVLLHGLFLNPVLWVLGRLVTGFCYAGLYIVIESWLNQAADNKTRGSVLALYLVASYGGLGIGQLLLNISDPNDIELFILVSILVSFALLPISLSKRPAPELDNPEPISLKELYNTSPLGMGGMFLNGLASGVIFGMGPVFGSLAGFSVYEISIFMVAFLFGGILFPAPIGWISDHFNRRMVTLMIALCVVVSGVFSLVFFQESFVLFLISVMFLGGLNFSVYGLCIALTNDHLKPSQMVSASSSLILTNGIGSCFGPVFVANLMVVLGNESFFFVFFAVYGVFLVFGFYRTVVSAPVAVEDQGEFVAIPARGSTQIAMQIAEEDSDG